MLLSEHYEKLVFQSGEKINLSRKIDADYTEKTHWHPFVELLLCLEEGNEVTINFNTSKLKTNDILVLFPGDLHTIKNVSDDSFLVIQFPISLLNAFNVYENNLLVLSKHPVIRYDSRSSVHDRMVYIIKSLFDLGDSDDPFRDLRMGSQILLFFSILGKLLLDTHPAESANPTSPQYKSAQLIAEACLYITQNCSEPLTLEDVSHYIGISKSYFSHLFKDYTKMTFVDFLTAERIKKAESLFLGSRKKIIDIALECGFTSMSSFNRAFKKMKGISPTEFRAILIERAN